MSTIIKIKKGLNINLVGKAEKIFTRIEPSATYAIKPTDFHGVTPKLSVKIDDTVKAGSPLFFDKYRPEVIFPSPVSGKVSAINRGDRRKLLEVVILADKEIQHEQFGAADPKLLKKEDVIEKMLKGGVWPFIRQRPYAVIANPKVEPKSIFISCFDSAPLAPDNDFVVKGNGESFQKGIDTLGMLTKGKIHLNLNAQYPASEVFSKAKGVQLNKFLGPHPVGNVGVQIHHIDPINKGDIVWYLYPQDVIAIGNLFLHGIFDSSRVVAVTGSEIEKPFYHKTRIGVQISSLIEENIADKNVRCISGNVLTGTKIEKDGYLGFYNDQLTVIPEGNHFEFIGWALPGLRKYSTSRSFFSWLQPGKEYRLHTNLNGGLRAFVMSDQYEKVFPMDILPVHLLKAILVKDIDRMEQLGIYEVAEEDFALCEFVCTSKIDAQLIVRDGLDLMLKEMS